MHQKNRKSGEAILYFMAKYWPSPVKDRVKKFNAEFGTDEYGIAYSRHQYSIKVKNGILADVQDLDVLEVGCGHGGITTFMSIVGARFVCGIDLNIKHLHYARRFSSMKAEEIIKGQDLKLSFVGADVCNLPFQENSFDLVFADNVFEHFSDPESTIKDIHRILKPGGRLLVPTYSSIYSKYGTHLKHGLKIPWANLFFSDRTIINVMKRLAAEKPELLEIYPGLLGNPQQLKDLRKHKDLNGTTYSDIISLSKKNGFNIEWFMPHFTPFGKIISKIPFIQNTILTDIFTFYAAMSFQKR
ncbi:MAG: class I SAM-dependent methyltransferase [Desulfobacteraceae bacterium]|nr:MAG: class I SAM-dependent methyltransferase [Desulfobacteraceae bacterium]